MKLWVGGAALLLSIAQLFTFPNLSTQREVSAEVEINAPSEQVWNILTDFSAYAKWNPYIYPAKGEAKAGTQLELTLHGGTAPVTFEPTVQTAEPPRKLSWDGRMFGIGVFDRTQTFTIEEIGPGRVRLTSRERFKGLLLPLEGRLPDDAQHGMDMMIHALRAVAELVPPPHNP